MKTQVNHFTVPPDSILIRRMHGIVAIVLGQLRAGADWGAGLASFSPLAIWLSSLSEMVSIGIASGVSANFGAEAKPSTSSASNAPCSAAEPARFEYDGRSSNAAPGYCLIGSVTKATFLNPAEVTAAMISATRP